MARQEKKLTARGVAALSEEGRYADGGGLYLSISSEGRRRWVFLYSWQGKRREMGLGSGSTLSLKDARDERDKWRGVLQAGKDPIAERDAAALAGATKPTFGAIADELIASKETAWRNEKHKAQWKMTLDVYAAPLRAKPVDMVTTADVLAVLKPIWLTKAETASRVRGRVEAVLDAARAHGHTPADGANPARWRGHLDKLLPKRARLSRGHHAALAYPDVPAFVAALRGRAGVSGMALEFSILTAARSGEVLGAKWSEIDLAGKVWTVPAERMKAGREHRVPLSAAAVALLRSVGQARSGEFVFAGRQSKHHLSTMALEMVLRRMGSEVTVHGFRSSFRDWAGEATSFPREVAEAALAHAVGDMTERAYRRGDALEKRRELMDAWARFLEGDRAGVVVSIKAKA